MISHEEFRFQRHLELWKDQNRNVKRIAALILLFGLLVLFRVLIPFSESSEKFSQIIQSRQEAKADVKSQNELIRQLEEKLALVQQTIRRQPWMAEKDKLVQKFQEMNRTGRGGDAQLAANQTIGTIASIVRNKIVDQLGAVLDAHPGAAEKLPDLAEKISSLRRYVDEWETDHLNRQWFSTLVQKDREMRELTGALDDKMRAVSHSLEQTIQSLNQKLKAGEQEIAALTEEIQQANSDLEKVLEQLFPKWMKGIINIQQMTQLFPIVLVVLLGYLAWTGGSLSRHYHYVARQLKLEDEDMTDLSTASLWTLTDQSRPGTMLGMAVYGMIILVVWALFEKGLAILIRWSPMAQEGELLLSPSMVTVVAWTGRLIFIVLLALVVFHRRIASFRHA